MREVNKHMTEFYRKIKALNQSVSNYALTFVDRENYGGKILISDGKIIWQSVKDISFSLPAFDITNGIHEISGQKFYIESLSDSAKIILCGAGNIALSVIRLAKFTGFYVSCIDDRESFTEEAEKGGADYAVCDSFGHALSEIPGGNNTYFIIATRGHSHDMECLRSICAKPHAYIGLVGSRKRANLIREKLSEEGITVSIHAPIGLDIEAETPEEIAVSIMAEVIREKNTRGKNSGYPAEILDAILQTNGKKALMTIIAKNGSAPRCEGAKMLLLEDGTQIGTIGGGFMEARILQKARGILASNTLRPSIIHEDLSDKNAAEEGMICGGNVDVMIEVIS